MSNLAKQLRAYDSGQRFVGLPPLPSLTAKNEVRDLHSEMAKEVLVEVRLGARALVNESVQCLHGDDVFTDAIRVMRRKIVEEVFGEFRPLIYAINEAQHNRDWAEASRLSGKLYEQMFVEGI